MMSRLVGLMDIVHIGRTFYPSILEPQMPNPIPIELNKNQGHIAWKGLLNIF